MEQSTDCCRPGKRFTGWFLKRIQKTYVIPLMVAFIITGCASKNPITTQELPAIVSPSIETEAPTQNPTTAGSGTEVVTCTPTLDDGLSPSYQPNAPVRSRVGTGHILTGVVRSSADCKGILGVKIELWPEYPDVGHPDEARATIFTDETVSYRFECDPPEHIHMRISAPGYKTIAQNSYHPNGLAEGIFEIVLVPDEK